MRYCLSIILVFVCYGLYGQSRDTISNTLDIEEVVVSQRRANSEVVPVQRLSGEALERLSANSVADAIRYFSGVQIKDYGGIGGLKTVNIRSMGSHHVGVFYDGVELGNAQNGVVDLGRFSLDNMESVAMYNGQKSSIFQSAKDFASSSTIYMTQRRPTFSEEKSYNINTALEGGSFATINPSLLWEQRLSQSISAALSGEWLSTSGEYPFTYSTAGGYDTTAMRQNGDVEYIRGEAALFGDIKGGEWRAKAYYYDSERGYPGASVREEPGVFQNEDRQWDNNIFVQTSLRKSISKRYSFKAQAKYSRDYLRYLSDPNLDVTTMPADNTYLQREGYGSIANIFTVSHALSLSLSTDLQYNNLEANLDNFVYPERYTSLTALASSLDLGDVKMQGSILYTYVKDNYGVEWQQSQTMDEWSPALILSYAPQWSENLQLRALFKSSMRMPTLNDLYYTFFGNIDLEPEKTTQYNIGATHHILPQASNLKRVEFKVDGYFNQIDNKIVAMPSSNQFRWTIINLGYVEIRGVDATIDGKWLFGDIGVSALVSYTYQRAQDFSDPTSEYYGGQIPYIPWHNGSLVLGGDYRKWSLNYSFIYTGERYESVANIAENYAQPWYTSDLSLSKEFSLNWGKMRLTAELNNLMNQQYEVVQCYPMPGRNYKLKVNLSF